MDWNSLKVFLAIAKHGSLSAAANELGVNHSTIFRRLKAFEEEIGARLFERINTGYEITALGDELLGHAQNIEDSFSGIERRIVGKDFQPRGRVKITAPSNIACRYLPRYIFDFNLLYPEIHVELLVSNQEFDMSNRQADIAVRATPSPPEHLIGRQVSTLRWSIFGSSRYEERSGLPANKEELAEYSIIGATGALRRLPAFSWLDKHFENKVITRCDDLTTMSYLVESGQGLALLPDDQSRSQLMRLFSIQQVEPSYLWLLTHPDLRNAERIKLLMKHLTNAFSQEWTSLS